MNSLNDKIKNLFQRIIFFWNKFISYLKRHKLISFIFVFIILLTLLLLRLFLDNSNYMNQKRIYMGEKLYNQVHDLYFYGKGFEYDIKDSNSTMFIEETNTEYYKLKSIDYITNNFTKNEIDDIKKQFDLINVNNSYYIKNFGRGISGYYETKLKIKKVSRKKIEFVAQSKFCKIDAFVYDLCKGEAYYTINKPFIIVKEEGNWKIDEYTSIFEFKDSEFK